MPDTAVLRALRTEDSQATVLELSGSLCTIQFSLLLARSRCQLTILNPIDGKYYTFFPSTFSGINPSTKF